MTRTIEGNGKKEKQHNSTAQMQGAKTQLANQHKDVYALIFVNWLWRHHDPSSISRSTTKAHAAHRKSKPLGRGMASLRP